MIATPFSKPLGSLAVVVMIAAAVAACGRKADPSPLESVPQASTSGGAPVALAPTDGGEGAPSLGPVATLRPSQAPVLGPISTPRP